MNRDGQVTDQEIGQTSDIVEIELREQKANTQRKMAWAAMASMVIFTLVLFSPILSDARVAALADLLGLFYIAQAGIVGAYMGVTAWMSNSGMSSSRLYGSYGGYQRSSYVAPDPDEEEPPVRGR